MQAEAMRRLQLETDLRKAVEKDEFAVYYQPIIALKTGEIVSVEALSRWERSSGTVQPAEFIPVAEETGIILEINRRLLQEACQQVRRWQAGFPGNGALRLNVNVTARQLGQPDLAVQTAEVLRDTGLSASSLEMEITEGIAMLETGCFSEVLSQISELGIRLGID